MTDRTILIVDDDPEILAFYRKIFTGSDGGDFEILGSPVSGPRHVLNCRTFLDPQELLHEYERSAEAGELHPLCILDMRMPILNGLATAVRMREIDPQIGIVICAAFSDVSLDEIRTKLHNDVFFVRKPFVPEEFLLLIHSLVGLWNTRQELKRTQNDLTIQCERLGMVLEGTRVGIWDWQIPSGHLEINERWAEIAGYKLEELEPVDIGTWIRLCHPDDLAKSNRMLEKVFSGELAHYDCECRMRHKNGTWVWVWDRGKVTEWSPEGKPLRMSGTHSDITEKRQAMRMKDRLIAMAAHEFRTPLATIRLGADLLSSYRHKMDEGAIQNALQTILKTTDYMTDIVTDILDLGALRRDTMTAKMSEIPLADLLQQTAADFRSATLVSTKVTFEWNGIPVTGLGIPSLLKRAVNNLLDNAVKYSPADAPIVLRLRQEEDMAVIEVEDQGRGISEEETPFLNEPFFRGANTDGIPGTGLGLPIAAEAMQCMGGNIAHSDRAGGGSIFTIRLPLFQG